MIRSHLLIVSGLATILVPLIAGTANLLLTFGLPLLFWLATGLWTWRGLPLLRRIQAGYYAHYLQILRENDLLYLFIEHEPSETLKLQTGRSWRLWEVYKKTMPTFADRVELMAENLDKIGRRAGMPAIPDDVAIRSFHALCYSFPVILFIALHTIGTVNNIHGLMFALVPWFVSMLILREISLTVRLSTKWLVIADVLLGEIDL